jgi:hypothetical protein
MVIRLIPFNLIVMIVYIIILQQNISMYQDFLITLIIIVYYENIC